MKSTAILLAGLPILLASLLAHGQGGDTAIPPRYEPIKTTKRTRLVQVCGSPEVQPGFGQTGAYAASGNTAVFASSVPAAEETDPPVTHLYIWDLEKNAFRREIVLAGKAVSAIALTPDGSRAVLGIVVDAGQKKKPICSLGLWDLKTGKEVRSFGTPREPIFALAISPDGTRALAGTIGGLSQWDLNLGKETAPFDVPKDKLIAAVAYLPDGKHAITGWGGEIKLWDVATGKDKRTYKPKDAEATIFGLTVSADGKRFASADYDLSARLWETDSGKELGAWRQGAQLRGGPASADLVLSDDAKSVFVSWGFLNPAGGVRDAALICRFDA